jgi:Fe-S-cluster-containing dehydrogenase component
MENYGILVDYEWCTGCHSCEVACQMEHGLPVGEFGIKVVQVGPWRYGPDKKKWQYTYLPVPTDQCNGCYARTTTGKLPSCVQHCQARCLEYGPHEELASKLAGKPKMTLFCV